MVGKALYAGVLWGTMAACTAPISVSDIASRPDVSRALEAMSESNIERHLSVLASDSFQGRRPGTPGEALTLGYLTRELQSYGLEPAGTEGFLQPFDLPAWNTAFQGRVGSISLVSGTNVAVAPWTDSLVVFERTPIVFAGYGIVSDAHGRDDIGDVDGAVVVVLQGGPPDDTLYKDVSGYGAKARLLAARGAAAMLVVWREEVVSWDETRWYYHPPFFTDFPLTGVIPILELPVAVLDSLLNPAGMGRAESYTRAARDDFVPTLLPDRLDGRLVSRPATVRSHNVIAAVPGSDPELAKEWLVLTAHWDHLGHDSALTGDQIYNGALDNASGSAMLLELARTIVDLEPRPRRGIAFVWTGAEEFGKLGARAYVSAPPFPIAETVANINFDFQNPWGLAHDLIVVGPGNTTLEDDFREVARYQGRYVGAEPWPERNYFEHSDQWEFAKVGVPALFPASGLDLVEGGRAGGESHEQRYFEERYHAVRDEVIDGLSFAALAEDARAYLLLTLIVAERSARPVWKDGTNYPEYARLRGDRKD